GVAAGAASSAGTSAALKTAARQNIRPTARTRNEFTIVFQRCIFVSPPPMSAAPERRQIPADLYVCTAWPDRNQPPRASSPASGQICLANLVSNIVLPLRGILGNTVLTNSGKCLAWPGRRQASRPSAHNAG